MTKRTKKAQSKKAKRHIKPIWYSKDQKNTVVACTKCASRSSSH